MITNRLNFDKLYYCLIFFKVKYSLNLESKGGIVSLYLNFIQLKKKKIKKYE